MNKRKENPLALRLFGWVYVRDQLLNPGMREKENSDRERVNICDLFARKVKKFTHEDSKSLTAEELLFSWNLLKEAYILEKSPVVLASYATLCALGVRSVITYLRKNKNDTLFTQDPNLEEFAKMTIEMAWGLVSLSKRSDTPEVGKEATNNLLGVINFLSIGRRSTETDEVVKKIFSFDDKCPSSTMGFLRGRLGIGSMEGEAYSVSRGDQGKLILTILKSYTWPVDEEAFLWLALRFPFWETVVLRDQNKIDLVINLGKIRQEILDQGDLSGSLKEVYALEGLGRGPGQELMVVRR